MFSGRRSALLGVACVLTLGAAPGAGASTAPIIRLASGGGNFSEPTPPYAPQSPFTTKFANADGVAWDRTSTGGVYFTDNDAGDNRVFHLVDGQLRLFAGSGSQFGSATSPPEDVAISQPTGVAVSKWGIHISSWKQIGTTGSLLFYNSFAFSPFFSTPIPESSGLVQPVDLSVDYDSGDINAIDGFIADTQAGQIRTLQNQVVAGSPSADPQDPADPLSFDIGAPTDVALRDATDFLFTNGAGVWRVTGAGDVDNDAMQLLLDSNYVAGPSSVAVLADGGYLIYDSGHHVIQRAANLTANPGPSGVITTVAGNGTDGVAAPGTPADAAPLVDDGDMAVTPDGIVITQGDDAVVEMIPAVWIASGPDALTTSRTATFELSSWDKDATYVCALDHAAGEPCASGDQFADLPDGDHVIDIVATTNHSSPGFGMASAKARRTWTVDATAPSGFALLSPAAGEVTDKATLSWQQSDDAGPGDVRYELAIDDAVRSEAVACADDSCSATVALPDGQHTWRVTARDDAGNARQAPGGSFTMRQSPTALITVSPNPALVGRTVTFDASASSDPNGEIVDVAWDLDGEPGYERSTGASRSTTASFTTPSTRKVEVRVTDSGGNTATAAATLTITAPPPAGKPLGVSINDGAQYTNDPSVTVFAVWPSFATNAFVSNDGGFKNGVVFPVAAQIPWKLDSSGPERLPKTIYLRFQAGTQTSETYQDDIILDQTPPKVLSAALSPAGGAARAAAAKVTLKLKAKDNVSGVGAAQVTKNKRKPGKFLKFKRSLKVVPAKTLYVRVRDRAGNLSAWRKAKH